MSNSKHIWQLFVNILFIFLGNMLPAGVAPYGSHLYLYLPNWHMNGQVWWPVIKFHVMISEVYTVRDKYLTLVSFGNMSLKVGLLWTGYVSAWLSPAGSKHNLSFPFSFGTSTKLLHHSGVSYMPCVMMPSYSSHSRSSLNSFCNV